MPVRPGVSPPRGFAAQGFALGYGPAGLQPGRVRAFGPCGPFGGRMQYAPTRVHAFGSLRVPGKICRRPQTPAPTRVVHSGPFGYPAKFAGVRRRPPLHGYVHSGPFGYPAGFPAPAGAVRRRPEASETLKQLV